MIERNENSYAIGMMCRALEVSRAGYYAYRHRPTSEREAENRLLVQEIRRLQASTRQSYGSPRIVRALRSQGRVCGRHRIARLMRQNDLGARRRRRFRTTTNSDHSRPCAENLLDRRFTVSAPNLVWVSDVTYIPTKEGWLYLAAVLDLFSRKAVGWGMGSENDTDLVLRALTMAATSRRIRKDMLFHSDRGSTYAAEDFTRELDRLGIRPSMSRKGNCWDNAVAEIFFSSFKNEWMPEGGYETINQAMADVFRFIEEFYNRKRLHSHLNYVSPVAFEAASNAN